MSSEKPSEELEKMVTKKQLKKVTIILVVILAILLATVITVILVIYLTGDNFVKSTNSSACVCPACSLFFSFSSQIANSS